MTKLNSITLEKIPSRFRVREAIPQPNSEQLKQTILALSDRVTRLLPIEQFEKEKLLRQLQPLKRELADATADRIDLGFLKAQRRQKSFQIDSKSHSKPVNCLVPKFALFTPGSAICSFSAEVTHDRWRSRPPSVVTADGTLGRLFGLWDNMPEPYFGKEWWRQEDGRKLWQQVDERSSRQWEYATSQIVDFLKTSDRTATSLFRMLEYAWRFSHFSTSFQFTVSTAFTGGLPDDIREQIPVWQQLYDEVLICREAADWTANVEVQPISANIDPLVIGRIDGDYWLTAKFDTTNAEEWVSNEWTLRRS